MIEGGKKPDELAKMAVRLTAEPLTKACHKGSNGYKKLAKAIGDAATIVPKSDSAALSFCDRRVQVTSRPAIGQMSVKKLNDEHRAKILGLANAGKTEDEIARAMEDVPLPLLRKEFERISKKLAGRSDIFRLKAEDMEWIQAQRALGVSWNDIAEPFNVDSATVQRKLRECGIDPKDLTRKEVPKEPTRKERSKTHGKAPPEPDSGVILSRKAMNRVVELSEKDVPHDEIAKEFNVPTSAIERYLKKRAAQLR